MGVEINRISIDKLAQEVREEAETLEELDITWDFKIWLAHFLDIVGQCWETRHGIELSVLTSILPDQKRRLRSPSELSRDSGVSDSLKNICENFGLDFRSRLLLSDFDDIVKNKDLKYLNSMIKDAVSKKISEEEVIEEAVMHLNGELPEDEECKPGTEDIQKGTAQLLTYIWETKQNPTLIKYRIPLITSKQRSVRWSPDRIMMAPICSWNESAKPFADAYPPNRVLADFYDNSQDDEIRNCLHALVEWGIAYPDPIITVEPAELRERRLDAISSVDTDGITVNNQKFSQIALLQPEVLNRCQEGVEEARALLGLVLCYIAPHDPEWQEDRIVKGRKAGEDIDIPMRGALWLADLKFRAWVPVPGEDEKMTKMVANAATLKHLLNPAWLQNNDAAIKLLSDWFEFDQLDLQLLGITPDEEKRRELRNSLAKLVESGGPDPEFYTSLLESIEADHRRRRDIARFRRLGIAVQEAIKSAMENYDLNLELVDRGFDYEVTSSMDNVLEDSAIILEVGPYLLEVKSTTQENVYLTPLQAITASEEASRYVLCVVDLHSLSDEDLDAEWTGARVEPLAKIVTDIGHRIGETCSLVEAAKHKSVAIRNESALRYEVSLNIWGLGTSILSWVESIYNDSK